MRYREGNVLILSIHDLLFIFIFHNFTINYYIKSILN